jgi:hypothetical protein
MLIFPFSPVIADDTLRRSLCPYSVFSTPKASQLLDAGLFSCVYKISYMMTRNENPLWGNIEGGKYRLWAHGPEPRMLLFGV